jgi:hypothetical protein
MQLQQKRTVCEGAVLAEIFVGRLGDVEDEKIAIFRQLRLRDLNTSFNKIKQSENNGPSFPFPENRTGKVTDEHAVADCAAAA